MRSRHGVKTAERLPVEMLQAFERLEQLSAAEARAKAEPISRTAQNRSPKSQRRNKTARTKRFERMMVTVSIAFAVLVVMVSVSTNSASASSKAAATHGSRASLAAGGSADDCAAGPGKKQTSWIGISNERSQFTLRCPK